MSSSSKALFPDGGGACEGVVTAGFSIAAGAAGTAGSMLSEDCREQQQ